jgi:hypothetical protein
VTSSNKVRVGTSRKVFSLLKKVGSLTNHYETECLASHLTTYAGGFIVLPAPINWSYVFANADFSKNKTIYITMISMAIIYILLMIYSRYYDKKDIEKLGVTPLPDNQKAHQYFYQIIVFTGQRADAGTQSKVTIFNTKNSIFIIFFIRFSLFYPAMMMKQLFEHLPILIERFYNVVESMHS